MTEPYAKLRAEKGPLRGIKVGPGEAITLDDLEEAELDASEEVDEFLGKRWPTGPGAPAVPRTIAKITRRLAAAQVLAVAHRNNQLDSGITFGERLEKWARDELKAIKTGGKGVKLADGSWDLRFPGSRNSEEGRPGGIRILAG